MQALETMFDTLEREGGVFRPSEFWRFHNENNVQSLRDEGMGNIKRTVARNYFTWVVGFKDDQFRHFARTLHPLDWPKVFLDFPKYDEAAELSRPQFARYVIFTRMLHLIARRRDRLGLLDQVAEPSFGNPFPVFYKGRLISQDSINSVLELYSLFEGREIDFQAPLRICEIGGGYGRNAYMFLKLFPNCTYTMIDIPPALYISQSYIAATCPERRVQAFGTDLPSADVKFMLPQQALTLPPASFDIVLNISSFHEMKPAQVDAYFDLIDTVLSGHLYTKQWKSWTNEIDGITVSESDYPVRFGWKKLYSRTSPVQPSFFEAVYDV